ncbi:MAG: hypothetical protein ACLSVG_04350 [Clostridia bacterium]
MDTYIKLAAKNLTHNKKRSILLSVVMVCCITFFLLATYFLRLTDGYFRFQERYDINARSFTVSPVETVEINREEEEYRIRYREIRQELLEMPHIETAFSSLGYSLGIKMRSPAGSRIGRLFPSVSRSFIRESVFFLRFFLWLPAHIPICIKSGRTNFYRVSAIRKAFCVK